VIVCATLKFGVWGKWWSVPTESSPLQENFFLHGVTYNTS